MRKIADNCDVLFDPNFQDKLNYNFTSDYRADWKKLS